VMGLDVLRQVWMMDQGDLCGQVLN